MSAGVRFGRVFGLQDQCSTKTGVGWGSVRPGLALANLIKGKTL